MDNKTLIILTFIVTGLWDVILRFMSLNYEILPTSLQMPFVKDLAPYFEIHTLLAAALIAGFVGATTQPLILMVTPFPKNMSNIKYLIKFLTVTFIISALYGFVMKWSGLFPHLEEYYYKPLGVFKSMYHDGVSGLIVQVTLLLLLFTIFK
jgi:hypothetical protein